jgi:hypothetical protein
MVSLAVALDVVVAEATTLVEDMATMEGVEVAMASPFASLPVMASPSN